MADGLSEAETTWLESRRPQAIASTQQFLTRLNITGFDAATYFSTHASNTSALPNIAIAASGGGYRALMNGAGALAAFDNRTTNATATGQLGGLLQSATYLAGLSGGSWLVGSLYANNYTSVENIINTNSQLWDFTNSIIKGPEANGGFISSVRDTLGRHYERLTDSVVNPARQWRRILHRPVRRSQGKGKCWLQHHSDRYLGSRSVSLV